MTEPRKDNFERFNNIGFEDFRSMAKDAALSRYEKVGFPDTYRAGKEKLIFQDMESKLPALQGDKSTIIDIGCGCSDIPRFLMERAEQKSQTLILIDSKEMLDQLSGESASVRKIAARYPDCPELFERYTGKTSAIIVYSVFQYIFAEADPFDFLDKSLTLLAPQGRMLIGDIPNVSMRKRFFESEAGLASHREFTGTNEKPPAELTRIKEGSLDDSVVLSVLQRARLAGFHAYVVPQANDLPMANRREDILIVRP